MSALVTESKLEIFCRSCGRRSPANMCDGTGLCLFCIAGVLTTDLSLEYKRLLAKRSRYAKAGARISAIDEQLRRVTRRMVLRVHGQIGNPKLAAAVIEQQLKQAVAPPQSRIALPGAQPSPGGSNGSRALA